MEMIKFINYVRSETTSGNLVRDLSTKVAFQDEHFLKPVLEDDALLYSLHDIIGEGFDLRNISAVDEMAENDSRDQILELEEKLQRAQLDLEARKKELDVLKLRLGSSTRYELNYGDLHDEGGSWEIGNDAQRHALVKEQRDSSYFASYSGHGEYTNTRSRVEC